MPALDWRLGYNNNMNEPKIRKWLSETDRCA